MQGYGQNPVTDPIAWELERLDRELNPVTLSEVLVSSCPLACPAVGLMLGLIVQYYLPIPAWVWLAGAAFISLLYLAIRWKLQPSGRFYLAAVGCLLVFASAGGLRLAAFRTPPANDLSRWVEAERTLATVRGTVVSDVRRENRESWLFGRWQWTDPGSSFLLSVEEVETVSGWQAASGRLFVHVGGPVTGLATYGRVQIYCWLGRFEPPVNPGQFNFKQYMENQGVFLSASVPDPCGIEALPGGKRPPLAGLQSRLRLWAHHAMEAWGGDQRQFSALPEALLLGQRGGLDATTYAAFQRTGLAHYISLSGMHVGILAGFCWYAGRVLGLLKRRRAVLCIVLITLYALIVPPRAATLRAVFLAEFFLLSILLVRRPHSLNTLALTALVLLMVRPTDLFSPGWQLSYGTVLGILLLTGRLQRRFFSALLRVHPLVHRLRPAALAALLIRFLHAFADMLSVGLAAWLGGAGILLWHFGMVTPLAALWTILVFPLVLIILLLGMAKLLLASLLPTLALILSIIVDRTGDLFAAAVVWIADLNWLVFQIGRAGLLFIALYYLWLGSTFFLPRRRLGRRPLVYGLGGFLLLVPLAQQNVPSLFREDLELTFLSVGHGLATVIECPDGTAYLFDCGSISVKDPGGRVVVPFLRHKGIRRLNGVIVSHGDLDHYNGLPEVLANVPAEAVCINAGFSDKTQSSASTAMMARTLEAGPWAQFNHCADESEGLCIRSLWPDGEAVAMPALSDNDKSEVLLIEYGGRRVLLCGDIEQYAQEQLLLKHPDLKADVLLLPHHGSQSNVLPRFVEAVTPSVTVISCAERRLNSVLSDQRPDVETLTTAECGAVTVRIQADGTIRTAGFRPPSHTR